MGWGSEVWEVSSEEEGYEVGLYCLDGELEC